MSFNLPRANTLQMELKFGHGKNYAPTTNVFLEHNLGDLIPIHYIYTVHVRVDHNHLIWLVLIFSQRFCQSNAATSYIWIPSKRCIILFFGVFIHYYPSLSSVVWIRFFRLYYYCLFISIASTTQYGSKLLNCTLS